MGAPALVVLAAGVGSRYGGPKQIEPVGPGGATLLDYSVYDARRAGFGKVVVVTRPELATAFDRIDATVALQRLDDVPGPVPAGRTKPWGTGPAVLALLRSRFAEFLCQDTTGRSEFLISHGIRDALHRGEARVRLLGTQGKWFGVTYPDDRPRVAAALSQLVAAGEYPERLWG